MIRRGIPVERAGTSTGIFNSTDKEKGGGREVKCGGWSRWEGAVGSLLQ